MANITFDPSKTTAPQNSFLRTTQGYVQGDFVDDPSVRMELAAGVLDSTVAQPVWGGMAIQELVPLTDEGNLGGTLKLAAGVTTLTGFSVFTQAYNMIIVPGNSVQTATAGMTISYFRLGSGARIKVKCSAELVAAVEGGAINQQIQWDYTNQQLIPYTSGTALPAKILSVNANSKVVSYDSGAGTVSWVAGNAAVILI